MKIGILTQPLHNNYGGLLQNYALQQVLKGMGHEVETVDWRYKRYKVLSEIKAWLLVRLRQFKELLLRMLLKDRPPRPYPFTEKDRKLIGRNTHRFVEKYISVCPVLVNSEAELRSIDKQHRYDGYVVGSDQVWRPQYNPPALRTSMFLSFTDRKDVRRIAYAASFGTTDWEFTPELTETGASLAKRFDLITVRERSAVDLCKEHFGVEAIHVLDPTMLLNREDYEELVIAECEPKSDGTLYHYILDASDEKTLLIENAAKANGLQPFTVMPGSKWTLKHGIEECVFPPVTSWLRGFMDAEMVITDSFHGTVFSIIFNKPFWVIENSDRGSARFESLLRLFKLEDRMIAPGQEVDWTQEIDWDSVNAIREREKQKSIALLQGALK